MAVELSKLKRRTVEVREGRRQSLLRIADRGITLGELKELQRRNLSETRATGSQARSRNLYELMEDLVLPRCRERGISYVELLKEVAGSSEGHKVQTFVSHWWGEEFQDLVSALDRYAMNRCIARQRLGLWTVLHSFVSLAVNFLLLRTLRAQEGCAGWSDFAATPMATRCQKQLDLGLRLVCCNALVTAGVLAILVLEALWNRSSAENWTFWICAFANNQYQLDHALDKDVDQSAFARALRSDIQEVVCIIDPACEIYTRIWCAFELFYVKHMLADSKLPIALINEEGVISEGGVRTRTMKTMRRAISKVKTEDATASNPDDKEKINHFIGANGCSYATLDQTLKELSNVGLDNVSLRRRALFIVCCLCPIASFVISNCVFWFAMALRPTPSEEWDRFREHRSLEKSDLWTKVGFYFLGGVIWSFVILLVSLSSVDTKREEDEVEGSVAWPAHWLRGELERSSDLSLGDWRHRLWMRWQRLQTIKETHIRIRWLAHSTRLQNRVVHKAFKTTQALMGPGLLPSILAAILVTVAPQASEAQRTATNSSWVPDCGHAWHAVSEERLNLEELLAFLWSVRETWDVVQVVYISVGLLVGLGYRVVRDRSPGPVRRFLEDVLL